MTSKPSELDPVRAFEPLSPASGSKDRSSHSHRQLIGVLGFILTPLLWVIAAWRPTDPDQRWQPLTSISAYYYSGAVVVFVGVLVALGLFLLTYRGYGNKYRIVDRLMAIIAGAAAVLVAFFPTVAPNGFARPVWWTDEMETIHLGSAIVLFAAFFVFSTFLFPQSDKKTPGTRLQNAFFIFCGVVIFGSIIWAAIALSNDEPIFLQETLALASFALSWLVKGRVDKTARAVGQRAVYYGRHPLRLARAARNLMVE